MVKIFISRNLEDNSKFKSLEKYGVKLIDQTLLSFEKLNFKFPSKTDWLLFYSRTGVKYFSEKYPEIPPKIKLAAVGKKTGEMLVKNFGRIDFQGDGEVESYINFFKNVIENENLTVVRATNSANSLVEKLNGAKRISEIIAYRNYPAKNINPINADIYIFTSSMNVEAFFTVNEVQKEAYYIAIGQPTAEKLRLFNVVNVILSESPEEESLFETCKVVLNNHFSISWS